MRIAQVVIFAFGVLAFLSAALFTGQEMGDILWRTGVVALLVVLACAKLWPGAKTG